MKTTTRLAAGALCAAAALAGSTATASAASAAPVNASSSVVLQPNINRVTCGSRTDWLRIFSDATTCWANPGLVNVRLYNVYEICGGNNSGYVRTTTWGIQHFRAHTCILWPAGRTTTVTQIAIYA